MVRKRLAALLAALLALSLVAPTAGADEHEDGELERADPAEELEAQDELLQMTFGDVVSGGPFAKVIKNLQLRGRGERLEASATTDVWAHKRFAYTGTFNSPCGGEEGAGVWVWDVRNKNKPSFVTVIESPVGSRSNDVKVAAMNSGDILVHSNEPCAGGPGGFEIYDVSNPASPAHLAHVQTDDINQVLRETFGVVDVGVHNLFLFTQGDRDYVAAVTEGFFGNYQVFDITDPSNPELVTAWGAEELCDLPQCSDDPQNETDVGVILDTIFDWLAAGFGQSANRFLHDITISADGTRAYLSNWDAGLVLLDISDVSNPELVSVALDVENGSRDGEVNSHAAWPSEDGTIVVETEEDFDAWVSAAPPGSLTFGEGDPPAPIPGTAISTTAGDDFEASQTGNTGTVEADSLAISDGPLADNTYPAIELVGDQPKFADTGPITTDVVWIGRACDGDEILNVAEIADGGIAVVRRGECAFREKNFNAAAAGADAIVIANNLIDDTPWGGVRIWDYTDPENPVLASVFDTVCSASPEPIPECDPFGTYSVHNVIVETTGNKVKAYLSWYWDGMVVLDVTDPYNPVEVARFFDNSEEFIAANGGRPHDFWGVYKEPKSPWIYGSDRNGGLYVFREQGSGSG